MSSLTNYPALYNNSNTNASSSLSSPESKKSSSPPQITDPLSSLSCSEFPNIELLRNKDCHAIVGNETVLELVIRPNMLRYGQSAGNIFNVEIPLTSLTKRKLPLGIVETNKLVRIIKVDTQTQQGNFQMWVPFSSVRWNTDDEDIDLLLTWAKSSIRKIGSAGHAPDTTGCTAQALLAVQHDFRQESVLSASQELTYYQGIQSGFTSAMVGNKGTMDFAQNPQSLLNYISPDKHLFQYIEIKTQYLPESNDFPFYPYTPPNESQHTTGADLLKSFMILLNANGLIIVNTKFILNNIWATRNPPKNELQQSGHAQVVAYYMRGDMHCFDIIDTQMASRNAQALVSRGEGINFQEALNRCCDNLKTSSNGLLPSRSYSIVCKVPTILIDSIPPDLRGNVISNKIVDAVLNICQIAEKNITGLKINALSAQKDRSNPFTQAQALALSLTGTSSPQLLTSRFNLQQAYQEAQRFSSNKLTLPKCDDEQNFQLIWIQVMNMQKACFPSVYTGGSFNAINPLVQTDGLWHVLSTCNKSRNRLALGSLLMIEHQQTNTSISTLEKIYSKQPSLLNNMLNLFTANMNKSILEIYSVCTSPNFALKGVCTTLMSQSMIHHINQGTRCFYLGVRLCSMNTDGTYNWNDSNIGAIKCYLRCGFKFILNNGEFWPLRVDRDQLLNSRNFLQDLVNEVIKRTRIMHVTQGSEMFGQTKKTVIYGHMYCSLWPFQGGLSNPISLVDLSLPSINSDSVSRESIIRILGSPEFSDVHETGRVTNWASKLTTPQQFFKFLKQFQGGGAFSSPPYIEQLYTQWSSVPGITYMDAHNETLYILIDLLRYSTKSLELKLRSNKGGKKKSKRKKKFKHRKTKKKKLKQGGKKKSKRKKKFKHRKTKKNKLKQRRKQRRKQRKKSKKK